MQCGGVRHQHGSDWAVWSMAERAGQSRNVDGTLASIQV
jgi:hypothetical protein